jgi:hypothetical protein
MGSTLPDQNPDDNGQTENFQRSKDTTIAVNKQDESRVRNPQARHSAKTNGTNQGHKLTVAADDPRGQQADWTHLGQLGGTLQLGHPGVEVRPEGVVRHEGRQLAPVILLRLKVDETSER